MGANINADTELAVAALPEVLQNAALRQLERYFALADRPPIPDDMLPTLLRLLGCSEFGGNTFQKEWAWLIEQGKALQAPPDSADLTAFAERIAASDAAVDVVKSEIRRYRNRYFLHVLWREFADTATLAES